MADSMFASLNPAITMQGGVSETDHWRLVEVLT